MEGLLLKMIEQKDDLEVPPRPHFKTPPYVHLSIATTINLYPLIVFLLIHYQQSLSIIKP